jgi:outer membrane biosynthesis protein TonB
MDVVSGLSRTLILLALVWSMDMAAQQPGTFVPPRISSGALPLVPPPHVIAGGEVLIEATIDRSGTVTRPILLRSTPPYSQLMLDAIVRWRFVPARAPNPEGKDAPVDAAVLIAAVYRPPTFLNAPTLGEPPKDLALASRDVPYPSALIPPVYPPRALHADTVALLFEAMIDGTGAITNIRAVASDPAFESAARDALVQWRFRPAMFRARLVPATVYVMFGFNPPVMSGPRLPLGKPPR